MRGKSPAAAFIALVTLATLSACGGGGGGSTLPAPGGGNPGPSSAPSATPPPGGGTPTPGHSPTPGPTNTPAPTPTPVNTPTPAPTPTPVPTPTPTPQPGVTPFAFTWLAAGTGNTNGVDDQFKTTNNDHDTHTGGADGDLMQGDPGALPQGGGQGSTVDGITCDTTMHNDYHVHAFVGVFVNGKEMAVSDAIGIVGASGEFTDPGSGYPNQELYGTCFYHIHTHDASGMVHLEALNPNGLSIDTSMFNVSQFLDIWGIQVSTMQYGPFAGPVTVYTSGQFSRAAPNCRTVVCNEVGSNMYSLYTGDPTQIPLYSHEVIWYLIGSGNPDVSHLPGVHFSTRQ